MPELSDEDRRRMADLTTGLATKAERIRRLALAGYTRADIARFLGVRYQYVYNVLTAPAPAGRPAARSGLAEEGAPPPATDSRESSTPPVSPAVPTRPAWTEIGRGGRVTIPAALLDALGLSAGDRVLVRVEEGELRLYTQMEAVRKAQALVRQYVPEGVSLVDELIQERRREAAQEEAEAAAWRAKHKPGA